MSFRFVNLAILFYVLAEGTSECDFPKMLVESSVKSVRISLSNHKHAEQSTSTPRVTPSTRRLRATLRC